jgi:hypothetical protein
MSVHSPNHANQEDQELDVGVRLFAGSSRLTPVSVDIDQLLCLPEPLTPANGFSCRRPRGHGARPRICKRFHDQHLVIAGDVGTLKDRGNFVLARGDFVVPCLDRHAEFVELVTPPRA